MMTEGVKNATSHTGRQQSRDPYLTQKWKRHADLTDPLPEPPLQEREFQVQSVYRSGKKYAPGHEPLNYSSLEGCTNE